MPEPVQVVKRTRTKLPQDESSLLILARLAKTARDSAGYSLTEAADVIGIPYQLLRRVERGTSKLSVGSLVHILGKYGYDLTLSISAASVVQNPDLMVDPPNG
jgi:transcriptional regulator with XRE-family HTH domain